MEQVLIFKSDRQIASIKFKDHFPHRDEIDKVIAAFGEGEYELVAPNGRKWRRVHKRLMDCAS